ncbi:putative Ig domain-containing protein [Trinickia sp. NRRL B-1857]|uniref:putative Ig domain-containing protein n=1 Tax=Trinickia sp. NRRL B-1857 TaxID=3162879 RepID=UPI003D2E87E6
MRKLRGWEWPVFGRMVRLKTGWLSALLLVCLGLAAGRAQADTCQTNFTVMSGASFSYDTSTCTYNQGATTVNNVPDPGTGAGITASTVHGTVTANGQFADTTLTYTNNGDGYSSDNFYWTDAYTGTGHVVIITVLQPLSITTNTVANTAIGGTYSQTIGARGGTPPYRFAVSSGALPAGLGLSSGGLLSGTPTAAGTFSFTVSVTDAANTVVTKTYSGFSVAAPTLTLTPASLPSGTQNSGYSQSLSASGGTAPYTYAVTSGALPSGMTLSGGLLAGTPTAYGTFNFTVKATDSTTGTGPFSTSTSYTLSLTPATPVITTSSLSSATVGASYNQAIAASGGNAPYTFAVVSGNWPPGLSLSSGGVISGTPTSSGSYAFTIKLTDAAGTIVTQTYYSGIVVGAPSIAVTPSSLPGATQGSSYSRTIAASGGTAPYTYAITGGSLPSGLALSSAGLLSGTPTVSGNFSFTVTATDSSGGSGPYTGTATYSLSVAANMPSISTSTLANGEIGATYNQTITAGGSTGPYTFSVVSGSLPAGVTLTSGGTLSGIPTASGSSNFTVQVRDGNNNTATQGFALTIAAAPAIGTVTLAAAEVGAAYNQTINASGGVAPYTFSLSSGSLPSGVTLSSAGVLSGTPSAGGNVTFSVQLKDANNVTATQSYTVAVGAGPSIATASLPGGEVGVAYSQTLSVSGGAAPYTFAVSSGTLPAGLSLASGGTLSGTPSASGNAAFTVHVRDANGATATQSYTISMVAGPVVSPTTLPAAEVGVSYSQTIGANGGTGPYAFTVSSGALPAGLSMSSGGALSGTPLTNGSASFTVQVKDANNNTAIQSYTISVTAGPIIGTTTLPGGEVGVGYSQTLSASAGVAPYTFSVSSGSLPAGLSLASGGALTGTPTAAGSATFAVQLKDANGATATQSYTIAVRAAPTIGVTSLPGGEIGIAYSATLSVSGGLAPYVFSLSSGVLPAGLSLTTGGALTGTPTSSGNAAFTVQVRDANGATATQSYAVSVVAGPVIGTSSLPSGEVGVGYSQTLAVSGGTAPYRFGISSGALPAGLSITSAGTISGTPTTSGSATFTVQVNDASNNSATQSYTVAVTAGPVIGTRTLPGGEVGVGYSQTLTASAGAAPYTFSVSSGSLPAGLSLTSGGTLSGTPTTGGNAAFAVQVKDANGATSSLSYTVVIAGGPVIGITGLPNAEVGVAYSQTIVASGGSAPYTFSVASGTLPSGLSLTSGGVLSGMPATSGSTAFTVQVKDANAMTAMQRYTVTVAGTLVIGTATLPDGVVGAAYSQTLTANAGVAPYTFALSSGSLPAGLALASSGALTGKPTASGSTTFTLRVTDANNASATQSYTVTMKVALPAVPPQRQVNVAAATTATVDITDGASGGPFTGAVIVSVTPASAGVATIVSAPAATVVSASAVMQANAALVSGSTYSVRFVPAASFAGTAVIAYTLSNASGSSNPAVLDVAIAPRADPSSDPDVVGLINAQVEAARRFADAQIANYSARLESLHGSGRSRLSTGISVATAARPAGTSPLPCPSALATASGCISPDTLRSGAVRASDTQTGASGAAGGAPAYDATTTNTDAPALAFWNAGTVDFGFANPGAQRSGFRFTTGGITLGADYRLSEHFTFGAGIGYGHDRSDIGSDGTTSTGDAISIALYASYRPLPTLFVDGVAGYGTLNFDSQRWVGDMNAFAVGKRSGNEMFASLTAGYEHRTSAWLVSPYGRIAGTRATLHAFTENGAGIDALTYFGQTVDTVSGTLGLRTEYARPTRWGVLLPYARIEFQHDFARQSTAGLAYADLASAGPAYYVTGTPFGSNRTQVGVGAKFAAGTTLFGLGYDALFGAHSLDQGVRVWFSSAF